MSRDDNLRKIEQRAAAHKAAFPTFDVARFMDYATGKPDTWVRWATHQPVARLNKSLHKQQKFAKWASRAH